MTKVRALTNFAVLFLLVLPSCNSTPAATPSSFVRQPSVAEGSATGSRPPLPSRIPAPRFVPSPFAPSQSVQSPDAQIRTIAAQVQVARPFPWRYIVIHHSASATGDAESFAQEHKKRGWDGLGYDFVIGNGSQSGDGQIEVGYRWPLQAQGAHAGSYQFNRYGIGICLVGNFDRSYPTLKQLASLERLVAVLMSRYKIPATGIIGHGDVRQTRCPGRNCPMGTIVAAASRLEQQFLLPRGTALAGQPGSSPVHVDEPADFVQRPIAYPYH